MKKLAIALALTAPVLFGFAAPASAATTINNSSFYYDQADGTGTFSAAVGGTGTFSVAYPFNVGPSAGTAGLSISSIVLKTSAIISGLTVDLNGTQYAFTSVPTTDSSGKVSYVTSGSFTQSVLAGVQNLVVSGSIASTTSFSGTLGFITSVPESSTWAMMILGMGAVGVSLRRRNSKVATRVTFA